MKKSFGYRENILGKIVKHDSHERLKNLNSSSIEKSFGYRENILGKIVKHDSHECLENLTPSSI